MTVNCSALRFSPYYFQLENSNLYMWYRAFGWHRCLLMFASFDTISFGKICVQKSESALHVCVCMSLTAFDFLIHVDTFGFPFPIWLTVSQLYTLPGHFSNFLKSFSLYFSFTLSSVFLHSASITTNVININSFNRSFQDIENEKVLKFPSFHLEEKENFFAFPTLLLHQLGSSTRGSYKCDERKQSP